MISLLPPSNDSPPSGNSGRSASEWLEPARIRVPLERIATPDDEVAYGVLFLASDETSYITGTELVIDGGYLAQ